MPEHYKAQVAEIVRAETWDVRVCLYLVGVLNAVLLAYVIL